MFDMLKGLGQFASVMKQMPKIREEMERLQQRIGQIVAEGDAGAGMVKVRVNGRMECLSVQVSDEALRGKPGAPGTGSPGAPAAEGQAAGGPDKELLEDLLKAAINQALERARQLVGEETGKMASGLGLPAGMNLPGMG